MEPPGNVRTLSGWGRGWAPLGMTTEHLRYRLLCHLRHVMAVRRRPFPTPALPYPPEQPAPAHKVLERALAGLRRRRVLEQIEVEGVAPAVTVHRLHLRAVQVDLECRGRERGATVCVCVCVCACVCVCVDTNPK